MSSFWFDKLCSSFVKLNISLQNNIPDKVTIYLDILQYLKVYFEFYLRFLRLILSRDFEGRRMRMEQIYACILLYFLLKEATFDVSS